LGRRSRKRSAVTESGEISRGHATDPRASRADARRERDEAIRASLEPVEPGTRPGAVTVAAIVAAALGVANIALYLAGVDVRGAKPGFGGVLLFAVLMFAAAAGMWRARYWAVLGFEALLGVTIVIAALSLAVASNVAAVVLCLAIAGLGGWLFWSLVRAMARIQMPSRQTQR
jgi:hypothetical protein